MEQDRSSMLHRLANAHQVHIARLRAREGRAERSHTILLGMLNLAKGHAVRKHFSDSYRILFVVKFSSHAKET